MQFHVSGMTCGHCAQAITRAVAGVDPQAGVKINVAAGTVTVDSNLPVSRIAEAIQAEGYEARPV